MGNTTATSEDLSYPIGEFDKSIGLTPAMLAENIRAIRELPQKLREAVAGLTDEQLETHYRPGGWTIRQTVHHVADSHINSICRLKLALTEENPTIRPYFEDRWAERADYRLPLDVSFQILDGIHRRWTTLLDSLTAEEFGRTFVHPDTGAWTIEQFVALYAWHGRHHTAHITHLRARLGW